MTEAYQSIEKKLWKNPRVPFKLTGDEFKNVTYS